MKFKLIALSRRYVAELRKHLLPGSKTGLKPAIGLGRRAVTLGLETLELARIHEHALSTLKLTATTLTKRAEIFFSEAIAPIVDTHRAARQSKTELNRINTRLKRRTIELADTNRRLKEGVVRRKSVEASLKKSGKHYTKLLKNSIGLQEDLRRMTRQVLAAQEEERKSTSRELQDEIAQTLLGINVRLLALKRGARANSKGLKNEITATQRLVGKTVLSTRQGRSTNRKRMKRNSSNLSGRYKVALRTHLKNGRGANLESARGLGSQAIAAGVNTLDLARIHENIVITELLPDGPPGKRAKIIKRAGRFFSAVVIPIEKTQRGAKEATGELKRFIEMLSQRTVELAASNVELAREVAQRKAAEQALRNSQRHYSELLEQSNRLQEELRRLSRQILSAQEDERKKISRELHDVIAQTLTGINVRLSTLKKEALLSTKGLDCNIALTQQLVEKSVDIVHQFARELRPAVLDDLGLIPALHSSMESFSARTGIRTHLTAFAEVEQLDTIRRTVLYRVAQEALNNVFRHARASRADVRIERLPDCICMSIKDDGKSFAVERVLLSKGRKRLGLLGMRERLEMIGGSFAVQSAPGSGTTVLARLPLNNNRGRVGRSVSTGAKSRQ